MKESELLLRACRASPEEDTPRLVLADAIQEEGQALAAEYIRESIHFYRNGAKKRRFRAVMRRGYMDWLGSLLGCRPRKKAGWNGVEFAGTGPLTDCILANSNDSFDWFVAERRRATFIVARGLPTSLHVTAPLLMEKPAMLFQFPLTRVVVADRKPLRHEMISENPFREVIWLWEGRPYPQTFNTWEDDANELPYPLFKLLGTIGQRWKGHYRTKTDAILALNAAAFEYGESQYLASREPVCTS